MNRTRLERLLSLARGLLAAVALTLAGMVGIAAAAVCMKASDGAIRGLNQALKCASILTGCRVAVGRGGHRGFITGMALAMIYMALGCGMVAAMGSPAPVADVLGEIMIGAALGGVMGAILANLPARRRRARQA